MFGVAHHSRYLNVPSGMVGPCLLGLVPSVRRGRGVGEVGGHQALVHSVRFSFRIEKSLYVVPVCERTEFCECTGLCVNVLDSV